MPFYPNQSPISPYPNGGASIHSGNPSPNVPMFNNDGRFTPLATPRYDHAIHSASRSPQMPHPQAPPGFREGTRSLGREDDIMEDEDSESFTWESNRSPNTPPSSSSNRHRRTQSANENTLKNAKRAHTVVERNYRERLNDKIADLALYLFETSSDCEYSPLDVTFQSTPHRLLVGFPTFLA